ncbi:hypothetical protein EV356DRAFT_498470 [Viridothelium virens]|uniref:Uncharacterized protein n=1 Tax=Viridothelium virens TaxID=1048519 RepID=A0A6A6HE70_VIRVR|nr:hypothetical protein EV356DRAFT_498470 [Viridothelium virens]
MSAGSTPSRNQRRLALRNTKLRAPLIQRNVTPRADQPASSILAEINNVSLRRRHHQQRQVVNEAFTIYQDAHPHTQHGTLSDGFSNDKENQISPECLRLSTPSPVPPVTSHLNVPRLRSPRSSKSRSTSGSYKVHIEHLETQLLAAHGQLEDYSSPKTRKAHSVKRRALSQECELLRQELSDVEVRCQRLIDEEAEGYKRHIRRLERDLEISEQRRMEADYDLEETKKTLMSVQASHVELERRLDSWSGILARSPTKVEMPTPVRTRPRPQSMLPRIPTNHNLQERSSPKDLAIFTPTSPMKPPSPTRAAILQKPDLPRKQTAGPSPCSPIQRSHLPPGESLGRRRRRQINDGEFGERIESARTPSHHLSDELGILGLGDVFTKHSQTTSSTSSSPSHEHDDAAASPSCISPGSPLAYKSDIPLSKPPRVMRRFVNTAGGPKPLLLSATLKPDQRTIETQKPNSVIFIRLLKRLSVRAFELCSAPFVAARWCLALFLLGPLAWRRVLAGPSMIYGS